MIRGITLIEPAGERQLTAAELPLTVGSGGADIRVPGPVSSAALATVALLDERLFVQVVTAAAGVAVNGEPVSTTRWLESGDRIDVSGVKIECEQHADGWVLRADYTEVEYQTLPPEMAVPDQTIAPRRPRNRAAAPDRQAQRHRWFLSGVSVVLALLLFVAFYIFTAHSVSLRTEPVLADLKLSGGLLRLNFGERYLLREGDYSVSITAEGYLPLTESFNVAAADRQDFTFSLEKLPGRVVVELPQGIAAEIYADDTLLTAVANEAFPLAAGSYQLRIRTQRFQELVIPLEVEGAGTLQRIRPQLVPAWADVAVSSLPAGAGITVDGEPRGTTPATVEIMAGTASIELQKAGYKTWRQSLLVAANEPQELDLVTLSEAGALLSVQSNPTGATVTVGGQYRGTTPLKLELDRDVEYDLQLSKPGYSNVSRSLLAKTSEARSMNVTLKPLLGVINLVVAPADAQLLVDGVARGKANQTLELIAVPHTLEIRKRGYATVISEVTPRPGLPQDLNVQLLTTAEAVLAAAPELVTTSQGAELRLIAPGEFVMGSPRREQGRRPNEASRTVRLTRPFYIGLYEVTNREYREFNPTHTSGAERYSELAIDRHPVVMLSWQDAARFCNWLSDRDGLKRAYVNRGNDLALADSPTNGYRLPTEAEWSWVARHNAGGASYKYPWGNIADTMPPPDDAGNYADLAAEGIVNDVLRSYDDGYPVTAPVGSFAASALGVFDLGGNVAEWVTDLYLINTAVAGSVDIDPVGPDNGRYHVIRGAGWRHSSISELRSAYRDFGDKGRLDVGFRLARYTDAIDE